MQNRAKTGLLYSVWQAIEDIEKRLIKLEKKAKKNVKRKMG